MHRPCTENRGKASQINRKSEENSNRMQNKTAEMENNAIAQLLSLSAEKKMSLEEIMNHR